MVRIGMIVLSPDAKGGGYSNTIQYTHSSTLRTLEEIFGVTPLLGDSANDPLIVSIFNICRKGGIGILSDRQVSSISGNSLRQCIMHIEANGQ